MRIRQTLGGGWPSRASSAPAPPPDTRATDLEAVTEVEAVWLKDAATKDADKWAGYFAEDGSALYRGAGILNGKAAIKAAMVPYFADPNFSMTFQSTRALASKGGDMVYSQGTYTMTVTNPKTKKPMTDKGKYLTVFTKQADGSWKAVADCIQFRFAHLGVWLGVAGMRKWPRGSL